MRWDLERVAQVGSVTGPQADRAVPAGADTSPCPRRLCRRLGRAGRFSRSETLTFTVLRKETRASLLRCPPGTGRGPAYRKWQLVTQPLIPQSVSPVHQEWKYSLILGGLSAEHRPRVRPRLNQRRCYSRTARRDHNAEEQAERQGKMKGKHETNKSTVHPAIHCF